MRARWGKRPASLDVCSRRLQECFGSLNLVSDMLGMWFEKRNKPTPERAVRWHNDIELKRLLEKGIHYSDYPRKPILELGYAVNLWNGNYRSDGAELAIYCGQYGITANNMAMVNLLPSENGIPEPQYLLAILKVLVEAWEPEFGEVLQLLPKGDDFDEVRCAGYCLSRHVLGSRAQVHREGEGYIWMDEDVLRKFV